MDTVDMVRCGTTADGAPIYERAVVYKKPMFDNHYFDACWYAFGQPLNAVSEEDQVATLNDLIRSGKIFMR